MPLNNCRICNSSDFDEILHVKEMMFGTGKVYIYFKCSDCGVLQIETPVHDSGLLYPQNYYSFSSINQSLKNKIKKLLLKNSIASELKLSQWGSKAKLLKLRENPSAKALYGYIHKNMSMLDVGSGSGELIEALYSFGYKKVEGIDPFIIKDLNKGWRVKKSYITDLDNEKKYDLIMMHHSFEHMENPAEIFGKVKLLLNNNGRCIIRIPVCDSYAYELYKENWVQLDAPRHVFLHTNRSMELLAEYAGLKLEKIENDSGIFQFIGSEQYQKGISLNSAESYYKPFYKKIFQKKIFRKKIIKRFKKEAAQLNKTGTGDQRIFILKKQ